MSEVVESIGFLNLVAFAALGVLALRQAVTRRDRVSFWAALTFGALGVVVLAGRVLPEDPDTRLENFLAHLDIALLVAFPYMLYRFTTAFDPPSNRLERLATLMTLGLVVWTLVLPEFPQEGDPRPTWFVAYLIGFLVHWTILSVVVAWRLYRAGRGQPGVARNRMHMLALAAAAITVAIFLAATGPDDGSPLALVTSLLGLVSGVSFLLGLAPPAPIRTFWRRREQARVRRTVADLIGASTQEDVADVVLAPMAEVVAARAAILRDKDGRVLGSHNVTPDLDEADAGVLRVDAAGAEILLWTSPYAPYFGRDELGLVQSLGALTGLALDRARLFAQEREARVALQRADELKTNFVALAAHELRTPVAAVHGIVETIERRGDALGEAQRAELQRALYQQTQRLTLLVEQLLDLSRLDADAISIRPQPLRVRERVEEIVAATAGEKAEAIEIEVPQGLDAVVDPDVFDRILSNLVVNALRYGETPIRVSADRSDRHLRVAVEDRGPGVPPEFVPNLFDRFTRSAESRERAVGTGLGLAIARSFANAHHGDLFYAQAEPRGARFELVLPARSE